MGCTTSSASDPAAASPPQSMPAPIKVEASKTSTTSSTKDSPEPTTAVTVTDTATAPSTTASSAAGSKSLVEAPTPVSTTTPISVPAEPEPTRNAATTAVPTAEQEKTVILKEAADVAVADTTLAGAVATPLVLQPESSGSSSRGFDSATPLSPLMLTIQPRIGFVLKTKVTATEEKVFINVFFHELVSSYVSSGPKISLDKKQVECKSYSIVIPEEELEVARVDLEAQRKTCSGLIEHINDKHGAGLEVTNYKIPRIRRGFVGDIIDEVSVRAVKSTITTTSSTSAQPTTATGEPSNHNDTAGVGSNVSNNNSDGSDSKSSAATMLVFDPVNQPAAKEPVASNPASIVSAASSPVSAAGAGAVAADTGAVGEGGKGEEEEEEEEEGEEEEEAEAEAMLRELNNSVRVPPKMQGWLRKRGHIVLNWKTRYFVLDNGYLTYYVDRIDTPPYGKDMKGQMCIAGYREKTQQNSEGATAGQMARRGSMFGGGGGPIGGNGTPEQMMCRVHLAYDYAQFPVKDVEGEGTPVEFPDLLLEAATVEEKFAWMAALQAHSLFIESAFAATAEAEAAAGGTGAGAAGGDGKMQRKRSTHGAGFGQGNFSLEDNDSKAQHTQQQAAIAAGAVNARRGTSVNMQSSAAAAVAASHGAPHAGATSPSPSPSTSVTSTNTTTTGTAKAAAAVAAGGVAGVVAAAASEDTKKWMVFLNKGERLVLSGLVGKPNPMGIHLMRELILTVGSPVTDGGPRLIYIDPKTLELKGEVLWDPSVPYPKITLADSSTFAVVDHKRKVYKFIPKDGMSAKEWVAKILDVVPKRR